MTVRKHRATIFPILLVLACLSPATLAGDWWVRADGSDSCDGRADAAAGAGGSCAFRTIAKGVSRASCGDTVHVGSGDYFEDRIRITKSCTTASPLVIEGAGVDRSHWLAGAIDVDDSACEPDPDHARVYRCPQPAGTGTLNSPSSCLLQRYTTSVYWEDENHTSGDLVGPVCLTRNTNGPADVSGKEGNYYEDGSHYWVRPWDDRDPQATGSAGVDLVAARSVCTSGSSRVINLEGDHAVIRGFTVISPCYIAIAFLDGADGNTLENLHVYGGMVWVYRGATNTTIRHLKVRNTLRRPNNTGTVTGTSWDTFSQCMATQGQGFTYEDIETYGCREGCSFSGGASNGTVDGLFVHGSFNHGLKIQDTTTHGIRFRDVLTYNNQEGVFIECPYDISFENSTFPFSSVLIQGNPNGCGDKPKNLDFHNCIINRMLWHSYGGDTWAKGGHDLDYNTYIEDNGRSYVQRNVAHGRSMSLVSWQNWADDPCPDCTRDPHSRTAKRAEVYISYKENDDTLDAGYDFDLREDSPVVGTASANWGDGVDIEGVRRSSPRDPGAYDHTEGGGGGGGGSSPACSDGVDNDGDGAVDYPDDFGCSSADDDSETGTTACGDGVDNDGDGKVDQADENCTSRTDDSESRCGDGVREPGAEECDGDDLGGATCESRGHDAGTLRCDATCHYDESSCNDRPGTPKNLHRTDTH